MPTNVNPSLVNRRSGQGPWKLLARKSSPHCRKRIPLTGEIEHNLSIHLDSGFLHIIVSAPAEAASATIFLKDLDIFPQPALVLPSPFRKLYFAAGGFTAPPAPKTKLITLQRCVVLLSGAFKESPAQKNG